MTYQTDTSFAANTFAQRIAALRADWVEKAAKRKIYRSTYNELNALSDRDLNDLGMSRSMIKRVAIEAAYDNQI
ncbi:DUF1127 domain-containing protein [Loktanella agnita]|uniref:DUF1127 domain-containing protein n=1 Tax=Loktanella agnita TaxID=287097 RepID=UPI00398790FB